MSGVNKFAGKGQGKFIMSLLPNKKITQLSKKQSLTSEKVTISEDIDKGTKHLDDKKEAVFTAPFPKKNY